MRGLSHGADVNNRRFVWYLVNVEKCQVHLVQRHLNGGSVGFFTWFTIPNYAKKDWRLVCEEVGALVVVLQNCVVDRSGGPCKRGWLRYCEKNMEQFSFCALQLQ